MLPPYYCEICINMITDSLQNHTLYHSLHPRFEKAFRFLTETDLGQFPLGRHEIDGDDLFVILMEYDTKATNECIMESHKKYIDIQYMIAGEEMMGTVILSEHPATTPYDPERDAAFYKNEYDSLTKVQQNHFTIFFPHDMHMPCISTGSPRKVKKAVFKVRV